MKKIIYSIILVLGLNGMFTACSHDDDTNEQIKNQQTVLMFLPWSNLNNAFLKNISALKTAIEYQKGLGTKKVMVFFGNGPTTAILMELAYKDNICISDTLKHYTFSSSTPEYTTATGLASIFNDVISMASAKNYGLIIGGHGLAWLPKGTSSYSKQQRVRHTTTEKCPYALTRFYGHASNSNYQTDITTLATAIKNSFSKTDYILFDDCYMANMETAYDLKDATNYILATAIEILEEGIPYATIGESLLNNNYDAVCKGIYDYYKDYTYGTNTYHSCTFSAIKTSEIDALATIMKQINSRFTFNSEELENVQCLDSKIRTPYFYDMGDYVKHLCTDETLYQQFLQQLQLMVPYKYNTYEYYYSDGGFSYNTVPINTFSGLTISDPSTNSTIEKLRTNTAWWAATH